jgi:hypothetical protein
MPPVYVPLHRRSKRLSRRERRIRRVYETIYKGTVKGKAVSVRQLAARQHVTSQTIRKDIKTIQRRLRKQKHIRIEILDGKLFYVNLDRKESEFRRQVVPTPAHAELHAYLNYSGDNGRNAIDLDIVKVVPNNQPAIMTAVEEIKQMVKRRFNSARLANMLKYGRSPVTPQSRNHFLYRHGHGEWHEF